MAFFDKTPLDSKTKNELIMESEAYKKWAKKNPEIHERNVRRTEKMETEVLH